MSQKTACPSCGSSFLQKTADENRGICRKCAPSEKNRAQKIPFAEKLEIGMRVFLAIVFAAVAGGLGYSLGHGVFAGFGLIGAIFLLPVGFIYGFFCVEINWLLRTALQVVLKLVGF